MRWSFDEKREIQDWIADNKEASKGKEHKSSRRSDTQKAGRRILTFIKVLEEAYQNKATFTLHNNSEKVQLGKVSGKVE